MAKVVTILGIESSCDDTAAAVVQNGKVLSNIIANQQVHEKYGGVVPELASRAHQQNIIPVVTEALNKAQIDPEQLDAVAYTNGPGLLGSLLVGSSFVKGFCLGKDIPMLDVHHMQAHVLAHFVEDEEQVKPEFPFLCLTVSGGHTQIVLVHDHLRMEIVGQTIDDAAGEAFDKVAKLLDLPYPGGPLVDKYAQQGDPEAFTFTHPDIPGLDYSFSGLKTSVLYFLRKQKAADPDFIEMHKADICASVQHTIVDILFDKLIKASEKYNISRVAIAGGVSANTELRKRLKNMEKAKGWQCFIPRFEYCTDNAAMVGVTGYYKFLKGEFVDQNIAPAARLVF